MQVPNDTPSPSGSPQAADTHSTTVQNYPPLPDPNLKGDVQGSAVTAYMRRRINEEQFDAFCIDCQENRSTHFNVFFGTFICSHCAEIHDTHISFVIDMAGTDGRDPVNDLEILRAEIREYDEELAKFPWLVVANKMDSEVAEENLKNFRKRFAKVEIVPISAELEIGLDDLRKVLFERVAKQATAKAT